MLQRNGWLSTPRGRGRKHQRLLDMFSTPLEFGTG
jgi:hypothetical protein